MLKTFTIAAAGLSLGVATSANATILVVFGEIGPSVAAFDATVTGTGATVNTLTLDSTNLPGGTTTADLGAFTITRNNGGTVNNGGTYGTIVGDTININPQGSGPGIGAIGSGITFTFDNAVNALGFEVGDWGTCCQPSALFISFDGGAPIQVGVSTVGGDVFFNNRAEVFVSALDDSGDFTSATFWGDGFGEFLVAGGTIRYANVGRGTLPPTPGAVPEPATWAMMLAGFGLVGGAMRARRRSTSVSFA
ncbi:MAG: PEPxxWA-CTERM sorting domain-containing protein [Sphingomonadaceae bacterium]